MHISVYTRLWFLCFSSQSPTLSLNAVNSVTHFNCLGSLITPKHQIVPYIWFEICKVSRNVSGPVLVHVITYSWVYNDVLKGHLYFVKFARLKVVNKDLLLERKRFSLLTILVEDKWTTTEYSVTKWRNTKILGLPVCILHQVNDH